MEKPGGVELSDFEELIDVLKAKSLVFSTGYMYRFNPVILEVLDRIEKGELGKIYSVEAQMNCFHPTPLREWLGAFPSGMLFYLGCHLIDLIYRIQGEPEEVIPLSSATGFDGVSSDDFGMVVFKYKNGVSFAKTTAVERGGYLRRQFVICGEKGTVELKPFEFLKDGGHCTDVYESRAAGWHENWSFKRSEVYDRYDGMMRNFAEMINGKENPYSYDYELGLYKLILKSCGVKI
jgi:predicted dehydrogenase